MLRVFELHEYKPARNSPLPHFAIAERKGASGLFEGVTTGDDQHVWANADDAAAVRNVIEKKHGLDLYVLKLYANGAIEEISWPKGTPGKSRLEPEPKVHTPGAGTW
jgi:hypothetical protein